LELESLPIGLAGFVLSEMIGAEGRNRTGTGLTAQGILRP